MKANKLLALAAVAAIPVVCWGQENARARIPTEYSWVGDDGLTLRFRTALEQALQGSKEFDVRRQAAKEKLRLYIPGNLYSSEAQGRLPFQYVVVLTNQDSKYLGVSIGSCRTDDKAIAECAQSVLKDAADAWKRRTAPQPWPR